MNPAHQDMDDMAEFAIATNPTAEAWHHPHFTRVETRRMPKGLDYQGRWPQAAEACTEVGADQDDERDAYAGIGCIAWPLGVVIAICAVAGAWHFAGHLVGVA